MNSGAIIWKFGSRTIDCSKPVVMGVVNVTPDSFSDGGDFLDTRTAIDRAVQLAYDGADILDIGGESTRPGSDPVSVDEELGRVIPVIEGFLDAGIDVPVSIDTRKLEVAEIAVESGAEIVNDVSALRDSTALGRFCAEYNLGLVLMHMLGLPKTMQSEPHYLDVIGEIGEFFDERIQYAVGEGIQREQIVLDPGIGFGKLLDHNLRILRECGVWLKFGRPIMVGPSRKRFIGDLLGIPEKERLSGTIGACISSYAAGASIFRVHDVKPVRQALEISHLIFKVPEINHD